MKDTMLLFDLDGTLWDSAKEVAESWNTVMQEYDPAMPPLTADDIHAVMGKTMDEIAGTVLMEMDPKTRKELFQKCERYEIRYVAEHGGRLFPDVRETLKALQDSGFSMAIISNCQTGYIDAFYDSMEMKAFFCDKEEWGNTGKPKADNIRLVMDRNQFTKAVYIGDTGKDEEAAAAAGIPFIHASYGFGEAKDPAGVIRAFSELPGLLEAML